MPREFANQGLLGSQKSWKSILDLGQSIPCCLHQIQHWLTEKIITFIFK